MADRKRMLQAYAPLFGALLLIFLTGVASLVALGISVSASSFRTVATLSAISAAVVFAAHRLGGARALGGALALALFLMIPAPLATFSYATTALGAGRPLFDAEFAALDRLMGFDWTAAVAAANASPALVKALGYAYHGTIAALIYTLIFLNVLGRHDRVVEFIWLVVGTCVLANLFASIWPAAGAYVHYRPEAALRSAISGDAGVWHLGQFEALRTGAFRLFDLAATEGLVTFPSYHTAMALAVPLALRGYGPVTWLAGAIAAVIVAATVPIGGHHLVDVLAGAAMTFAVFALLRRRRAFAADFFTTPPIEGAVAPVPALARRGEAPTRV